MRGLEMEAMARVYLRLSLDEVVAPLTWWADDGACDEG
jgi:hypothetical protein